MSINTNYLYKYLNETHYFTGKFRRNTGRYTCIQNIKFAKCDDERKINSKILRDHVWLNQNLIAKKGDIVRFKATVYKYQENKIGLKDINNFKVTLKRENNKKIKKDTRKNKRQNRKNNKLYRQRQRRRPS